MISRSTSELGRAVPRARDPNKRREGVFGPASHSKDGLTEALKSERRRSNQLEKDLRSLKQQLNCFSEINPEEYSRLQEAEGRTGGDSRCTFFDVFKGQLDSSFRLCVSKDINTPDSLEPLDSSGQPLLGEDGRPMSVNDFLDQLRIHPVYGFLFQQRGAMTMGSGVINPGLTANPYGEVLNPQSMSAAELYRASFASPTAKKRAL